MGYFFYLLSNIILPIFLQIGVGFFGRKKLRFDVSTLAKVQLYIFIPALLIVKIYDTDLTGSSVLTIILQKSVLSALLWLVVTLAARLTRATKTMRGAMINSVSFYNSGNYCLPLIELLYHDPFATSVQIIIMMFQNILTNTMGIFNVNSGKNGAKKALMEMLKMPMLYAIAAAVAIKFSGVTLYAPIYSAMNMLGGALVPTALVSLGAQLADARISLKNPVLYLTCFIRLLLAPAISLGLVFLFGLHGVLAQVLVISSAAPTAVNAVLLSIEYNNEPDFTSQAVFLTTLLSAVTMSLTIFVATSVL